MVTNTTTAETELIDTGEKRDALGRRRTPADRRAELLVAFRQSGLTQKAFALREGLTYTTFCCWAQAERRKGKLPVAPVGRKRRAHEPVRFVEAKLPVGPPAAPLEVRLPDGTSVRGTNASEVAALVRALRS